MVKHGRVLAGVNTDKFPPPQQLKVYYINIYLQMYMFESVCHVRLFIFRLCKHGVQHYIVANSPENASTVSPFCKLKGKRGKVISFLWRNRMNGTYCSLPSSSTGNQVGRELSLL